MSDYPMLISNKLHSFRNFRGQSYNKKGNKGRRFVFRTESPFNFIEISIFVTRFFEFEF